MSLRQRARDLGLVEYRGKWCVVVDGSRLSTGQNAELDAAIIEAAERKAREIERVLTFTPQGETCGAIMKAYLADKGDDRNCTNPESLGYNWVALQPHFEDLRPDEIDRDKCRDYHRSRRDRANGTINKDLRILRAGLNWHLTDKANPAQFEFLPEDEPRDRWIDRDEFQKLLDECRSPHVKLFLHLAIATAARKSAILEMTWAQVRWKQDEIWLGRKHNGKKRATVPMTTRVRTELEIAHDARTSEYVIEYGGKRIREVRHAFDRICERAKIDDFTIHDLRHTAAVWMCGDGVAMEKISTYLGHTRIDITRNIYAKYQPSHLRDAAAALEV